MDCDYQGHPLHVYLNFMVSPPMALYHLWTPIMNEQRHILILDDDRSLSQLMADYLVISGCGMVTQTHTPEDFWEAYQATRYNLIFLDHRLPGITGLEILEKLEREGNITPVIMMTGDGSEELAVKAIHTGAFDYLVKGKFDFSILPALLFKAIRQQHIQAEVRRSRQQIERQAILLNNVHDSIVSWDLNQTITYWNPVACELFELSTREATGQNAESLYFQRFSPPISVIEDTSDPRMDDERQFLTKDGKIRWVSSKITPIYDEQCGEITGFMDIARDISSTKAMESQLQQRLIMEKLLSSISNFFINISPENIDMGVEKSLLLIGNYIRPDFGAIYLVNKDNQLSYYCGFEKSVAESRRIAEKAGTIELDHFLWLQQQLKSRVPLLINDPADLPDSARAERDFFDQNHIQSIIFIPMVYYGEIIGVLTFFMTHEKMIWQHDHTHLLQTFSDLVVNATIQKRAAQELQSSEARYRAIVEEHQTELICRIDPTYHFTFVNETFCNYYQIERTELLGMSCKKLVHPEDFKHVQKSIESCTPQKPITSFEIRTKVKNSIRWQEWTVRAISEEGGRIIDFQGVGRDITQRKEIEDQLKTAQTHLAQNSRMAAIGELAASIAHQISNPLTTIIAEAQLLTHSLTRRNGELESANAIIQAGWRAQHVIQELLKFSEAPKNSHSPVSINETIEKAVLLAGTHIQKSGSTTLEISLGQDVPPLWGNTQQLEDLWVTLLLLARKATRNEGRHTVKILTRYIADDNEIQILVMDDGIPLSTRQLENVFEPQLVPSGEGRGTGIELSLCREIVRQHQGKISVKMKNGLTIFEVSLPGERKNGAH